jgi:hypothetical protein
VTPLIEIHPSNDHQGLVVAVKIPKGKGEVIYLPYYLLLPLVFTEDNQIFNLSEPTLDPVGSEVLETSLRLLGLQAE